MKCPKCGSEQYKVIASAETETMRRRKRLCIECRAVWTTMEITGDEYKRLIRLREYVEQKVAVSKAKKQEEKK